MSYTRYIGCHLDVCLENIMLQNADFIAKQDGTGLFKVNNSISIKICDFGVAELFPFGKNISFKCNKYALNINNGFQSPQCCEGYVYDARKADIWSIGIIFYQLMTNENIYNPCDIWNEPKNGYLALITDKLKQWLVSNNSLNNFNPISFDLLQKLLKYDENCRLAAPDLIEHKWFKVYHSKYIYRINKKFNSDLKSLQKQSKKISLYPLYTL